MKPRAATLDPRLEPRLRDLEPLVYAGGASSAEDLPAHVRAASAIRSHGGRLVILQDDVNAVALHHAAAGTEPLLLPLGPGGRRTFGDDLGNKRHKMDLEACARLPDGRLIAFGSGSTPAREHLVVLEDGGPRVVAGRGLYQVLRATPRFAGSELNVEGAVVTGDHLRLFQRGNGAPSASAEPVNATGDVPLAAFLAWLDDGAAPPALAGVVQYDLGRAGGAPFTFTDAALLADGRIAFLACAEDSPDAVRDGEVLGARFGIIDNDGARLADILEPGGAPSSLKLEGLEPHPTRAGCFAVVADVDRAEAPALLGRLEVRGLA